MFLLYVWNGFVCSLFVQLFVSQIFFLAASELFQDGVKDVLRCRWGSHGIGNASGGRVAPTEGSQSSTTRPDKKIDQAFRQNQRSSEQCVLEKKWATVCVVYREWAYGKISPARLNVRKVDVQNFGQSLDSLNHVNTHLVCSKLVKSLRWVCADGTVVEPHPLRGTYKGFRLISSLR